jgi:uncharacterized protein YbjT (DUF2867 family)
MSNKVLVLCATGKVGKNSCKALKEAGFDVYGTTRSAKNNLAEKGINPVVCNYTVRKDLDSALATTGAKKMFVITDFFLAAKGKSELEIQQGKHAIDAAKAANVEHLVFISVADAEHFNDKVKHIKTKVAIEKYLKESGLKYSILRPVAFFENFDDGANYNPLKKGQLKFLSTTTVKFCSTYDIGRAAAVMFKSPAQWQGKTLDVVSWAGDLSQVAAALEKVTPVAGQPTPG